MSQLRSLTLAFLGFTAFTTAHAARSFTGLTFAAPAAPVTDAAYLGQVQQALEVAVSLAHLTGHCTAPEVTVFPATTSAVVVNTLNTQFGPLGYQTDTLPIGDTSVLYFKASKGASVVLGALQAQGTSTALLLCSLSGPGATLPVLPVAATPGTMPAVAPATAQTFQTLHTPDGFAFTLQGCHATPRASGELYQGEKFTADNNTELKCSFTLTNAGPVDQTFTIYAGGLLSEVFDDLANEIPAAMVQLKDQQSPYLTRLFLIQGLSIRGAVYFYVSSSAQTIKKLSLRPDNGKLEYHDVPITR